MRESIGQRLAIVVLVAGVVGGFGSGIASCARHARDHHRGEHCQKWQEDKSAAAAAAAAAATTPAAATTTTTTEPAPAPTPVPASDGDG